MSTPGSFLVSANGIVARYRASGLGLKAFAEQEGLPPGRLQYWIYEKSVRGRGRGPTQLPPAAAAAVFQEVKVTPAVGPAYYLVDQQGDGNFVQSDTMGPTVRPPMWILRSW